MRHKRAVEVANFHKHTAVTTTTARNKTKNECKKLRSKDAELATARTVQRKLQEKWKNIGCVAKNC